MKDKKEIEAFRFLQATSYPSEEAIEGMSEIEVDDYLREDGVDIEELNSKINELKNFYSGRYALIVAKNERIKEDISDRFKGAIPATREGIIQCLLEKYGDNIPLAARNFKSADYDDLRQLFIDLAGSKDEE